MLISSLQNLHWSIEIYIKKQEGRMYFFINSTFSVDATTGFRS